MEKTTSIITIYRPPDGDIKLFFTILDQILQYSNEKFEKTIVCGDLNIKMDNKVNNINYKKLIDIMECYELKSMVNEHTRVVTTTRGTSCSSIDYIMTNISNNAECKVFDPGFSDHYAQELTWQTSIDNKKINENYIQKRITNENTISNFKHYLNKEPLNLSTSDDINIVYKSFWDHVRYCFEITHPFKKIKPNTNDKKTNFIMSRELKSEFNELKHLNWLRKQQDNENIHDYYKKTKKTVNEKFESEKKKFYSDLILNAENPQKNYGNYFANLVNDKYAAQMPSVENCTLPRTNSNSFFYEPYDQNEVMDIISNLKNKTSLGYDEIPTALIKACRNEFSFYISQIINMSMRVGQFPYKELDNFLCNGTAIVCEN
ncbi:hypothetical protein JTB14_023581 [Gonioctena quinquepunctata]|nr:hypothetical protein JTB14_023581 [Gonioctena quinquepunctata]